MLLEIYLKAFSKQIKQYYIYSTFTVSKFKLHLKKAVLRATCTEARSSAAAQVKFLPVALPCMSSPFSPFPGCPIRIKAKVIFVSLVFLQIGGWHLCSRLFWAFTNCSRQCGVALCRSWSDGGFAWNGRLFRGTFTVETFHFDATQCSLFYCQDCHKVEHLSTKWQMSGALFTSYEFFKWNLGWCKYSLLQITITGNLPTHYLILIMYLL